MNNRYSTTKINPLIDEKYLRCIQIDPQRNGRVVDLNRQNAMHEMKQLLNADAVKLIPYESRHYEKQKFMLCVCENAENLPLNRSITDKNGNTVGIVRGPFFLLASSNGKMENLSISDTKNLLSEFEPELFFKVNLGSEKTIISLSNDETRYLNLQTGRDEYDYCINFHDSQERC